MSETGAPRKRYDWTVLQQGELPLRPGRRVDPAAEHRSTSVLIWPEGQRPSPENTILTDPCFTEKGLQQAEPILRRLGVSWNDLPRVFVTHPHNDHCPSLPAVAGRLDFGSFEPGAVGPLAHVGVVPCPGHFPSLGALAFQSASGEQVRIAGDAILDEEWLRAWGYYWPNGYSEPAIVETWRSVARILSAAGVVVPGHGPPIRITAPLLYDLVSSFPDAEHAEQCADVLAALGKRFEQLSAGGDEP
jgi:glyoxylase-like metal-dependent hydrolase (beta-lactamase superfamily II)